MPLFHIFVLALVQGITEFLPISSSAHLVLVPFITGWEDQGLIIDVAVHVGTLAAVTIFFWRDIWDMLSGAARLATGRMDSGGRLALMVLIGSVPAIAAGMVLHEIGTDFLRNVTIIAWATLIFGILLGLADRLFPSTRRLDQMRYTDALWIGLAQALALIPGTSRSGITMTMARALSLERTEAARFSLLLSIPVILGAGTLAGLDLYRAGDVALGVDALIAGILAFLSAIAAIALLMLWLRHSSFMPFVLYRVVLGLGLLYWIYA
ncbi:MAG: undecaprenyl-diphosphate phosphatase [Inquilinaceae bacterium]